MRKPQVFSHFIGDTELQYLLYDNPGPAIVLIHATGFNPWQWDPIARELATQYKVVAPFFCDHRNTDPEKGGLRWPILANDLVTLCRHLDIEHPFMVGHSMGGGVCILTHGVIPDFAAKLLLIEPIVLPGHLYKEKITVEKHPFAGKVIRRRNRWQSYDEVESYLRSKPLFNNWDEEMLKIYIHHGISENSHSELELTCSPAGEASLLMGSLARDPWPLIPTITCPVLILEGEHSDRAYLNQRDIAARFPNGIHRLISNAGHLIPMEKPHLVLDIIKDFFLSDRCGV